MISYLGAVILSTSLTQASNKDGSNMTRDMVTPTYKYYRLLYFRIKTKEFILPFDFMDQGHTVKLKIDCNNGPLKHIRTFTTKITKYKNLMT